jgi:hypothetical protein
MTRGHLKYPDEQRTVTANVFSSDGASSTS